MAGGVGARLRPLTCNIPKPMMPLMNKPIMEHILKLLKEHGITEVCATLQYLPEMIKNYFEDGSDFGVNLKYYIEEIPLGTAGSVKNAQEFLDETFIVISGDVLCDINLAEAIEFHKKKRSIATLVLTREEIPLEYGVVVTTEDGNIIRFLEKPSWAEVFSDTINTGIYILEPEVLDYFEKDEVFDFSKDLFPLLLKDRQPLFGMVSDCYWCDIGSPEQYIQAHKDIFKGNVQGNFWDGSKEQGLWLGKDISWGNNCTITPPVTIGNNCRIGDNVIIEPYTVIDDNTIVDDNASIKRSIIWKNSYIGKGSEIRGSIICGKTTIKDNVSIFENAIIGEETIIEPRSTIKPGVKIWPGKTIEEECIISSNIIWGTKSSKYLFGERGISGKINIDVTPELAAKLGASFGCQLPKKSKIAVSGIDTPYIEMIKIALISGILSLGHEVFDLGNTLLPITKKAVPYHKLSGGVHLREKKNGEILIEFFDSRGTAIDKEMQRKIQHAFIRDDFQRCIPEDIKKVNSIPNFCENYITQLAENYDTDLIRQNKFVVGFSASEQNTLKVLSMFLEKLGVKPVKLKKGIQGSYDLVVIVEDHGNKIQLGVDDFYTDDTYNYLIDSIITLKSGECDCITLPLNSPRIIQDIAKKYNADVKWSKISTYEPPDPFEFIGKVIEYICANKTDFEDLLEEVPSYYWKYKTVPCPWEDKGKVIRRLMEIEDPEMKIETIEGVKLHHNKGCVLVLPDAEKPLCKIYGEGYTEEFAESITEQLIEKIKGIRDE